MKIENLLFNENGHLRSGWRFAIFLLSFTLLSGVFGQVINKTFSIVFPAASENNFYNFIFPNAVLLASSVVVGYFCGRFFEKLPFRALGIYLSKNWARDFFIGLMSGAASLLFAVFIAAIFGGFSFELNRTSGQAAILQTLALSLLVFTIGAAGEEAFFRGYVFQTFVRAKLVLLAVILTSFAFATVHTGNPSASNFSWLNTFLAGIWFAAAYLKTRNLALAVGLHLSWNWLQGAILGINVSGISSLTPAPLFLAADNGPVWLTGGKYGIEGGIACAGALIFSIAFIWFLPFGKSSEENGREKSWDTDLTDMTD